MRSLLAVLLLANYLLMVGAGLCVSRPAAPAFSAAHPYRHSAECQQHNYLRLDCFEHCNGEPQHEVRVKLPTGAGLHFLAQLKGLDVHCPAVGGVLLPGRRVFAAANARPVPAAVPAPGPGFGGRRYPPPKWG